MKNVSRFLKEIVPPFTICFVVITIFVGCAIYVSKKDNAFHEQMNVICRSKYPNSTFVSDMNGHRDDVGKCVVVVGSPR